MADGITINYEFVQPEVGASQDTWGAKLNQNWADADEIIKALDDNLQGQIDDILNVSFTPGDGISITGDLNTSLTVAADLATAADLRAGAVNKVVAADAVYDAADVVTLTDAPNITVDLNAGFNFDVTLGGNRTLDNPTNQKPGQGGVIVVRQDATGGRTLVYGSHWRFPAGVNPLSDGANDINMIGYFVLESGIILASLIVGYE